MGTYIVVTVREVRQINGSKAPRPGFGKNSRNAILGPTPFKYDFIEYAVGRGVLDLS